MPDNPIVQVSYGDFRLLSATQDSSKPKRRLSLKWLSEAAAGLWTLIFRTVLVGSVLAVLAITASEVMRDTVVIEEIGLPESLAEMGYSGAVAAHRIWDSTQWINDHAGTTKDRASLITASRQIEITEPGTGLSLSGLVQVIRRLLGREQPRIAGEFVCRDPDCKIEEMELRLRAFQDGTMAVAGVGRLGNLGTEAEIDAYFDRAALTLLAMIDPYVRASFLYEVEENQLPATATDRARALVASLPPLSSNVAEPRSIAEATALLKRRHHQRAWAALLLAVREDRSGNGESALQWATLSVSVMRTDRVVPFPNAYNVWGTSLGNLGRHEEAIEKFRAALEIDPDYAFAYNNWGNSLGNLGRHEEAIEKYRAALEIDPDYAGAYNGWGNRLADLGRHEEAIEKYRAAVEIDPDYAGAYIGWGNRLADLGRHEEAIEKYRAALKIDPDYAGAYNGWGNRLADLGRHEEAIEKYRAALEIDPDYAFAYINWGISLGNLGRHEEAIEKYRAALEIDPDYAGAYNGWGNRLADLGRHEEAIEKYRAALEIDPDYAFAYNNWVRAVELLLESAGPDRCTRFASALPPLERIASSTDRAPALAERFDNTRMTCTPLNATEIAELEAIEIDYSASLPAEKSISISPQAKWIKVIVDSSREASITVKITSQIGDPYLQVFDSEHNFVGENDDDPDNPGTLDSKLSFSPRQAYYLLRVKSLSSDESLATLLVDLSEDSLVSGD